MYLHHNSHQMTYVALKQALCLCASYIVTLRILSSNALIKSSINLVYIFWPSILINTGNALIYYFLALKSKRKVVNIYIIPKTTGAQLTYHREICVLKRVKYYILAVV